MLQIFLLTFALFSLAVLAMTVGVLASGRSLKGSCGGPSCTCANEGRDMGSCENDLPLLPNGPSGTRGSHASAE